MEAGLLVLECMGDRLKKRAGKVQEHILRDLANIIQSLGPWSLSCVLLQIEYVVLYWSCSINCVCLFVL